MTSTVRAIAMMMSVLGTAMVSAQQPMPTTWPGGHRAAIVLTYDDALTSQLDNAVPVLDAAGFKGTFFLSGTFKQADVDRWRAVAKRGHELGNHTVFHPCAKGSFDMPPQQDTANYSVAWMLKEIGAMNNMLAAIDGKPDHTFATPCGQHVAGGGGASGVAFNAVSDAGTGSGLVFSSRFGDRVDATAVSVCPPDATKTAAPAAPTASFPTNSRRDSISYLRIRRTAPTPGLARARATTRVAHLSNATACARRSRRKAGLVVWFTNPTPWSSGLARRALRRKRTASSGHVLVVPGISKAPLRRVPDRSTHEPLSAEIDLEGHERSGRGG